MILAGIEVGRLVIAAGIVAVWFTAWLLYFTATWVRTKRVYETQLASAKGAWQRYNQQYAQFLETGPVPYVQPSRPEKPDPLPQPPRFFAGSSGNGEFKALAWAAFAVAIVLTLIVP